MVPTTISNVLAVDDDPIIRQVLAAFFAKHGIARTYEAANGADAIKLLNEHREIDLIISDLHMPDANGVEFISHLAELGCRRPIVVVSSANKTMVDGASALAQAYQLNFVGALKKPISFDDLAAMLGLADNDATNAA